MIPLKAFEKVSEYEWRLPLGFRSDMRVPVRFFATRRLLEHALGDRSVEQAMNASTLPGVMGEVMVMPDVHQGYGFPIGGVAAMSYPDGVISPGGIGYDINCGVRLLSTNLLLEEVEPHLPRLADALNRACPSGVGKGGRLNLSEKELRQVCGQGSKWVRKQGMASETDVAHTEESGCISAADPGQLSPRAVERGRTQLGTLGSGNHFLEVSLVEQVFDAEAAGTMGLHEGCLTVMIHCGSRGLGHQVCSDHVKRLQGVPARFGIHLPDRELVCAPMDSKEGKAYLGAMSAAANFAFANRQVLAAYAREAFEQVLAGQVADWHLRQVYDVAHNIGKIEEHSIDGKTHKVCVHRKGATRAFGPGMPGVPQRYQKTGQPVLVPGSMGTASWVLAGTEESMARSLGSCCHGAGRVMSRSKAKKQVRGEALREELSKQGIVIKAGSMRGLAEEAPQAYKDVDAVVETVSGAGIARKVARLRPVVVIKG
jgi:tRNA-splicing ligase RtcB (3'-phosphate/5'-hydroxy nucleic acid ligase)